MKNLALPLLMAAVMATGLPADARTPDQDFVYGSRRAGQIRPLREIEAMVVPRMNGARYIGPEMIDPEHYRLKFLRGSAVIWVDVDGRTGQIINRTGE